jgi:hypothetical protein
VLPQLRRPGLYLGAGYGRDGWEVDAFPSISRSGPGPLGFAWLGPDGGDRAFRVDVAASAPLARTVAARVIATVSKRPHDLAGIDGELALGAVARF